MKKLLMVVPLVILLCFAFGCQDKEKQIMQLGMELKPKEAEK